MFLDEGFINESLPSPPASYCHEIKKHGLLNCIDQFLPFYSKKGNLEKIYETPCKGSLLSGLSLGEGSSMEKC